MAGKGLPLRIGVLAFQGDVREHVNALNSLGARAVKVRRPTDLLEIDGLIIPGGESSVMDKLCRIFNMTEPLKQFIARGKPVFGTCAGLIMLSDNLVDAMHDQQTLGGLHVTTRRNAFGTQLDSFETELSVPEVSDQPIPATFIRAPIVEKVGAGVHVLAQIPEGPIVAVQQDNLLGISFHPEVNGDTHFHEYFLKLVAAQASR